MANQVTNPFVIAAIPNVDSKAEKFMHNIAKLFPDTALRLRLGLILAAACLIAGLFSPIMTLEKFYFFDNTVSIASGLVELFEKGQYLLFAIIILFSVILPILKLLLLNTLLSPTIQSPEHLKKILSWIHQYGKWSMLDVFVVAVLFAAIKLGAVARVEIHYGLYLFATAVILTMLITARVVMLSEKTSQQFNA